MKKTLYLLICAAIIFTMSFQCAAAAVSTDVLKGTPVVDGILDEIYTQSASYKLEDDNLGFYIWGGDEEFNIKAVTYYLWDDTYLYACTVVEDNDIIDVGAQRYEDEPGNWMGDCVEIWYGDGDEKWQTHNDSFGHNMHITEVGADPGFDYSDMSVCPYATSVEDGKYVVEYALPLTGLKVGYEFGMSLQINDQTKLEDGADEGYASGVQIPDATFTLSDKAVIVPEIIVEEPATAVPATEDAPAVAPATFDIITLSAAACALVAAAMIKGRKNR